MHTTHTTTSRTLADYAGDTIAVQSVHEWTPTRTGKPTRYSVDHATDSCPMLTSTDVVALVAEGPFTLTFPCDLCWPVTPSVPSGIAGPSVDAPERTGGPAGTGRTRQADRPTEKQVGFLVRLLTERGTAEADAREAVALLPDRRSASKLIDALLAAPKPEVAATEAAPATTPVRPNRFAGRCADCGGHVPAEAGSLTGKPGAWVTRHLPGECTTTATPSAPAASTERVTEDGMYRTPDGTIYKVQIAHHGTGNLYAKKLVVADGTGEFVYAAGALRNLTPAMRLSLDEAKEFGKLYGVCCNCAKVLTDERSIAEGIGPVCARRFA